MKKISKEKGIKLLSIIIISVLAFGILSSTTIISLEQDRLDKHLEEFIQIKQDEIELLEKHVGDAAEDLYEVNEKLLRNQMKLNLQSAYRILDYKISEDIKQYGPTVIYDADYKSSLLTNIIDNMPNIYDQEGDMFVINNNGIFEMDNSDDCGQPTWTDGVPYIDIENRVRTTFDEVAWQYETQLILYEYGIINHLPDIVKNNITRDLGIEKKYELNTFLNSEEIYTASDINYIKQYYPDVFKKLKDLNVVMHSDFELAEKTLKVLSFQRDTTNENLYWYFNKKPYKEILESKVIPLGSTGFNNETKNTGGGKPNPKYLKFTIVSGAQIERYNMEYEAVVQDLHIALNAQKAKINETIEKEKIFILEQKAKNKVLMYLSTFLAVMAIVIGVYFYGRTPSYASSKNDE